MEIQTRNALIRPWAAADAGSLARYADNPRIAACMRDGFPHPYTLEDAHRFIRMASESEHLLRAIVVDGVAVGGIGIHYFSDVYCGTAEIGYWLAEPFWGKGIVTEAVRSLVPVVFEKPGIVRLQAGIFSNNPASARVLEKCGFSREAVHRCAITKNGLLMDEIMYAILKKDFKDQTGRTRLP